MRFKCLYYLFLTVTSEKGWRFDPKVHFFGLHMLKVERNTGTEGTCRGETEAGNGGGRHEFMGRDRGMGNPFPPRRSG